MKNLLFLCLVVVGTVCHAQLSQETVDAMTWGAKTKVTFRVVDSQGTPVSNALFCVGWSYDYTNRSKERTAKTDENGLFVLEVKSRGTFTYFVEKDGYYRSQGKHSFYVRGETRVKDGHWEPWNPTVKIVLKEKRKSVPLIAKGGKHHIPISETPVGFDFSRGEIIAPLEVGRAADILFQYSFQTTNSTGHCNLTLSAANPDDGMIILRTDEWSALKTVYEAPVDGYLSSISFERDWAGRTFSKREELDAEAYIVFRCRTKRDEEGKLITAHYGIIHGPLDFGQYRKDDKEGVMIFRSTFNPTPNDRNLEWNGSEL